MILDAFVFVDHMKINHYRNFDHFWEYHIHKRNVNLVRMSHHNHIITDDFVNADLSVLVEHCGCGGDG